MAVPVLWRTQKQRYSLQAAICPHCAEAIFPPRAVCPVCLRAMRAEAVSAKPQSAPVSEKLAREFIYAMPAATVFANNGAALATAGDD